jgi:hypothetical protein
MPVLSPFLSFLFLFFLSAHRPQAVVRCESISGDGSATALPSGSWPPLGRWSGSRSDLALPRIRRRMRVSRRQTNRDLLWLANEVRANSPVYNPALTRRSTGEEDRGGRGGSWVRDSPPARGATCRDRARHSFAERGSSHPAARTTLPPTPPRPPEDKPVLRMTIVPPQS